MKTAYTSDNTRSSIAILLWLAVVVTAIAALIGLSDKPDVSTIVISPAGEAPIIVANNFGFGSSDAATSEDVVLDEVGEPFDDSSTDSESDSRASSGATEARTAPEGEIIVVPTLEPTPTPEIAAAVEPTPFPDNASDTDEAAASTALSPSLPTTSGTVQGTFFTKGDENDGAVVAQNLITVSFAEDGSGAFQGVLDITYANDTHILLNMSGPLTWAARNPQVEATLEGAFTLDAAIDTDDVTTSDAKLSISSLEAGSGSLCTTKCFGFTFPPQ
ncbi:MAG: hypothetical protein ACI9BK_000804 [Acidimicrobiales bacterium]|jgi:hypothetical protein